MFSRDEMQRAIEDALKSMEGVALELYRRGREEAREELETVKRERDEARAEVERLRRLLKMAEDEAVAADDHGRREAKRADVAEAEVERLQTEAAPMNEHFNAGYRDGARDAYRRGAEAMREACIGYAHKIGFHGLTVDIRALPIPEEP